MNFLPKIINFFIHNFVCIKLQIIMYNFFNKKKIQTFLGDTTTQASIHQINMNL